MRKEEKSKIVNLVSYIKYANPKNDIRLFDGDAIFKPSLQEKDPCIIQISLLAELCRRFINIEISGQISSHGKIKLAREVALSDVMNSSGPRKAL